MLTLEIAIGNMINNKRRYFKTYARNIEEEKERGRERVKKFSFLTIFDQPVYSLPLLKSSNNFYIRMLAEKTRLKFA